MVPIHFFWRFLPTPYSFWCVCISACRRSGGVSLYTDVSHWLAFQEQAQKSIHASRNADFCQRPTMFSKSSSLNLWYLKGLVFNSSMPIFTGANIKTLFSTSISCPPKLLGEQCVFSYLSCECDASAQRQHCNKPKRRILAPFRDKSVALTDYFTRGMWRWTVH